MILSSEGAGAENRMEYEEAIDCYTKATVYNIDCIISYK